MGIPVERLMRETSSSQFVEWMAFRKQEPNLFHREDFYFAEILAAIYKKLNPKRARKIKAKDFLIQFVTGEQKKLSQEDRMLQSKKAWGAILGIKPEDNAALNGNE